MRLVPRLALGLGSVTVYLALTGCGITAFVSDKERQEFKDNLDDDDDGVPAKFDCDDENPLRRPTGTTESWADETWVEIPYDGIDNDCDDLDAIDVDGDGFPGIAFEDYAAMQMERLGLASPDDVVWPTNVDRLQKDCVDSADQQNLPENIEPQDVNPAVLDDEPYDGVDRDCAGDNDFDDDGDGQMPATINGVDLAPLVDQFIADWGLQGVIDPTALNAFGDCDDQNGSVYTGAPGEDPYDGVDQDCSGDNDFDQDGDGYFPQEYSAQFIAFVQNFHPEDAPDGPLAWGPTPGTPAQPGDCLDRPHPNIVAADPALVYPGADDAYYDGIDSDCDGSNDFDQDGDLYIRTEDVVAFNDYVANWSGPTQDGLPSTVNPLSEAEGGDCDDMNPTVAPGNLELIGDANDADCDLNPDGTPWGFGGYAWDTPTWPRLARTNAHYVLATTGAWTSLADRQNPAIALLFDPANAAYDAEDDDLVVWNNLSPINTFVHGSGFDLVALQDKFWIAATYKAPDPNPAQDRARILIREHIFNTMVSDYEYELANRVFSWQGYDVDLDLQLVDNGPDDKSLWVLACGGAGREDPNADATDPIDPSKPPSFRSFVIAEPVFTNVATQEVSLLSQTAANNDARVCFQEVAADGQTALLTICDDTGCESYDANTGVTPGEITASADTTWSASTVREADVHEGLLLLAHLGGGATIIDQSTGSTYDAFAGEEVISVDGMWRNGVLFVAAVVETGTTTPNTVKLSWGADPANGWDTTVELPVYDYDDRYRHQPFTVDCDPLEPLCTTGRNLDPYKISLHADGERLALAMSAFSLDAATEPIGALAQPLPQDAVGWAFLGFDDTVLPPPP